VTRALGTVILSVALSSCSIPPSLLEQIIASGQFRAVTRNSPATFYYDADEPRGIDYAIIDSNTFPLLQHSYPDVREAFTIGHPTPVAWSLPKTAYTTLRESVSAYLAELQATGNLDAILDRYYFSSKEKFDYVGSRAFTRHFESRLPVYKDYFLTAEKQTAVDWRLLAAMAYQESHWDADAVSPTGVKGIMMLTSKTAGMLGIQDRTNPEQSIYGGAEYFVRVTKKVPERIGEPDRTWFALAAYNVGYGHLEDARIITEIQGGNPDSWNEVRERLPLLAEPKWFERVARGYARGHEPMTYVDNVRRYYDILRWMTADDSDLANESKVVANSAAL
jgi:membrane-bound lytic murein transglycosylase F